MLEQVLKKKRVSKREFARKLGMDYRNTSRFYKPDANPRWSTLVEWARVLKVRVRDLIDESQK
jgi:transcriptional regulator with XRE-family HTH domain